MPCPDTTLKENLGLPNREDVRAGVITYKIAAHAAEHGVDVETAIPQGMREKAAEFEAAGGEIYQKM
ncbi:MAG: hypothetical protein Rubg2KO_31690 [Rubricoccaceae bacterium]